MTVTGGSPSASNDAQSPLPGGRRRDVGAVREVCPFIAVDAGTWRSAYAAREHRCHAVNPVAQLTVTKQRQLCLVAAHGSCATYRAAVALRSDGRPPAPGDDGAALWTRQTPSPVVLEPARRMGAMPTTSARNGGQALLIGLMVLAFIVLVIARTQTPAGSTPEAPGASGGGAIALVSPSATRPTETAAAASGTAATPDPTPGATPAPTPSASPAPTPASEATPRTYKVKGGDTLSSIAAKFGTTVKKIARANNISDPRLLHVGQVLEIP